MGRVLTMMKMGQKDRRVANVLGRVLTVIKGEKGWRRSKWIGQGVDNDEEGTKGGGGANGLGRVLTVIKGEKGWRRSKWIWKCVDND